MNWWVLGPSSTLAPQLPFSHLGTSQVGAMETSENIQIHITYMKAHRHTVFIGLGTQLNI